jgi:hypothetical protein
MVVGMPNPRARGVVLAAAATALACLLSGCSADADPSPTADPTATEAAPIFASDEEALAAAVAAYEAYAAASNAVATDGGSNPERIAPFVTDAFYLSADEEFAALREVEGRLEGTITYDTTSVIERSQTGQLARLSIYLCRDVSQVRAISADGTDVTPADRPERVPSVADFISSQGDPSVLLVNGIEQWSGDDFC